MAKEILAQTNQFGKIKNNSYVNSLASRSKKRKDILYHQSGSALGLTNDDAVAFLRENGFGQTIPGTHFAPIRDYASFLGIKDTCLQSYMYRHSLDSTTNTHEAMSTTLESFFRRAGLLENGAYTVTKQSGGRGVFDFKFNRFETHYITEWTSSMKFYTARCVLGVLPFIAANRRRFGLDEKSVILYEKLLNLLDKRAEEERLFAAAKAAKEEEEKKIQNQPETTVTDWSKVVSPSPYEEILYQMVERAVRNILSGTKVELTTSLTNT